MLRTYPTLVRSLSTRSIAHAAAAVGGVWEPMIGIEVHAQIKSRKKLFSDSLADASVVEGATTDHEVSLFDAAFPGTLPRLNSKCVDLAIRTALALEASVQRRSSFDRKHYYYPDLPCGYQITQKYAPIARGGRLHLAEASDKIVRLQQIQLEQDTGKSTTTVRSQTKRVSLSRAGAALMEIVSEPDMRSAEEAAIYVRSLQALLRAVGASDGNMELGSMRCDVNVSVRKVGEAPGTRCEVKNLNTVRGLVVAIKAEVVRQRQLLERGLLVEQETRALDEDKAETYRLRSKEDAPDYRYMPDPNLAPLIVELEHVERIRASMPTLPAETRHWLIMKRGLSARDADALMSIDSGEDVGLDGEPPARVGAVRYFESVVRGGRDPRVAANWIVHKLAGQLAYRGQRIGECGLSAGRLGELIDAVENGKITGTSGKLLLRHLLESGSDAPLAETIEMLGLGASPRSELGELCRRAILALPKEAELVEQGNERVVMKIVGQVMKLSKGAADAQAAKQELLRQLRK